MLDFPEAVYAGEIRRALSGLRFVDSLEERYVAVHVRRVRLRARVWFTAFAVSATLFSIHEIHRSGLWEPASLLHAVLLLPCSLALTWLTWSRHFQRFYLPAARVLVPICGILVAAFIARAVANGQTEELAALPLNLIAIFFFAGLLFREALATALAMLVTFSTTAVVLGLPQPMLFKSMLILTLTCAIGAIVYRDIEQSYRKSFVEGVLAAELAARDSLSGLMNRRAFDEHLLRVWQHAQRDRRSVTILMIDIDYFKEYNDTSGHQAGDVALRKVGQVIQDFARRPLDLAARYGGEEFAVILYDLSLPHVQALAEQIRLAVQDTQLQPELAGAAAPRSVTISIGAGCAMPTSGRTAQGAVQLADEALYEAKRAGRNRIVVKGPEEYRLLKTGVFKRPGASRSIDR